MDRFDLEASITDCWNTKEDLILIREGIEDDPERVANALLGLSEIHDLRCKKMWEIFEEMVGSGLVDLTGSSLEDEIMSCWSTKEDMDLVSEGVLERGRDMSVLVGLANLHDMRCERLFSTYERMAGEGRLR